MAIHTTTASATTLTDGYVYLTDCPLASITSTEIPSGYTVVKIESEARDYDMSNDIKQIPKPTLNWTTATTENWLINLKRLKQTFRIQGTISSDGSGDTVVHKENNLRFLTGAILDYENSFESSDRRGGTFSYVKNRIIPYSGGTTTVQEKFAVACLKLQVKEIGTLLDKFEVIIQLIEGVDKLDGSA